MAKRRVVEESEEASESESYHTSSSPSKRARFEDESGDASRRRQSSSKNAKKNKSKAKGMSMAIDEEDAELDRRLSAAQFSHITADGDDNELDATSEAVIAEKVNKPKKKGGTAQMGIIESVEMHQFMCHPRLSFKFGPKVNFITGNNGSGKSAVLSALTIALGGKTISTGRGSGLKSFIREGQSMSEISVTLKNQGDEAYKPDIYGESIIVTRRFTKEGSSSYKIKSADGKTVSTRRDELSAICDHMNIQVDNPMNILTQDAAKQFLSRSHPTDKYQFFLRGTQLTQLSEEYETCLENIGKTTRTLQLKREETPDLEKAFREADARNKEATKAREKQNELVALNRELAWAHVKSKQDEMVKKLDDAAKARRRLPRIEQSIEEAEATFAATTEKVESLQNEMADVPSIDTIKFELDEVKKQITVNKKKIRECKDNEKEMNEQMRNLKHQITGFEEEIKRRTETDRDVHAERELVQRRLNTARSDIDTANQELELIADEPTNLQNQLRQVEQQGRQADADIKRTRSDIDTTVANIEQCKRKDGDEMHLYGRRIPEVLAAIQKASWSGQVPIGPFGLFVAVKDHKWAMVMRTQMGALMSNFAVTDNRDRHQLRAILDHHGNNFAQIVVSEVDLFDYSQGEPPQDVMTVLRALDIKDEWVKRILINQRNIEKVVLADTRKEGDTQLIRLGGNGLAWTSDLYVVRRYAEGGGNSSPMTRPPNNDPRWHMFTSSDRSADIQRWEAGKAEAEHRLQTLMTTQSTLRTQFSDLTKRFKEAKDRDHKLRKDIDALAQLLAQLEQEAVVEAPVDIALLEENKATAVEETESIAKQFANVHERSIVLDQAAAPLVQKKEELQAQITDWEAGMQEIKNKITAALEERVKATKQKEHWMTKLADETRAADEMDAVADVVQTEFQQWTEKAERIGPEVENPRRADTVKRQIESLQKALAQHEKQQGASPEEIAVERDNAKLALETHKRQMEEVSNLNKALKTSLAIRMGKWVTFRTHISARCKHQFQHHLWKRGFYGKVIIDHSAGTLDLKVDTDEQGATQAKNKDIKSLSGGEKSYTTTCLLLALWESIQCPIRCLDEFDVFMDPVNRKISVGMMIDIAHGSDKQYILITPLDIDNVVKIGPTIRIHKMRDPERNQKQLAFS